MSESLIGLAAGYDMATFINAVVARGYQLKDMPLGRPKPIIAAANYARINATQALVAAGEDINTYDSQYGTLLFFMLSDRFDAHNISRAVNYVYMLLKAGADIYAHKPNGEALLDTIHPSGRTFLEEHAAELRKHLVCKPGAGIDPQRLIQDGKPTTELLQYCGAHMLPELFTEHRWKGKGGEGLALFEAIRPLLPDYYKPMLEAIDLTPLRREVVQKDTGPAVTRYVRNRPPPEAERC